ncbi:MAG: hypothetical protein M3Y87_33795, partial [Myxococcota bacterium]|nr:hypothetical protein [Myxococcota bacterium]
PSAPSSAGTSSPGALAADEKWGRASGWKTGSAGGSDATDLAIKQLLASGKTSSAARVAWDAGRLEDAARWFAESGQDYETGAVLYDLDRLDGAMEALLRVPPEHKRHRVACVKLVDVASRLGRFDFELDRVLTQFAKAPPLEGSEVATYLTLGDLYARNGFHDGARGVLEQVLLHDPDHEGARAALDSLPAAADTRRSLSEAPRKAPARSMATPGSRALPALPSLEEFVAEARRHAPKKVTKGTSP